MASKLPPTQRDDALKLPVPAKLSQAELFKCVKVAVRIRPLSERETYHERVIRVIDEKTLLFDPTVEPVGLEIKNSRVRFSRTNKNETLAFDFVFSNKNNNGDVYRKTTRQMLNALLNGYNCSVIAYGASATGKTFTMLGSDECVGVVSLTLRELYRRVDELLSEGLTCHVGVAYLEVGSEVVRDLLRPDGPPLTVRDDAAKNTVICDLPIRTTKNADAALDLLERGNRNRAQHPSHAIFQVYTSQTDSVTSTSKTIRTSKMSFVDLASSECLAAVSQYTSTRARDGAKINLSHLALENCISALSTNGAHRVPYRDSKLTRVLKDCLGGTCQTLIIATVSPSKLSLTETHSTLKRAQVAMKIQVQDKKNLTAVRLTTCMYPDMITELEQGRDALERKLDEIMRRKNALQAACTGCCCRR
ncbi:hypothetical protein HPB48_015541 [Haemaphysalis longicornis]|uniref:Kinesin motor domain-containing protein n=1 Tax=Haemaphysalis longicornis TaxID=44386 RepID=A0A9J6FJL8_HAELO|nr:hypothetical protein HPB48_015541 [Haemaphysalis longicornis]